MERFNRVSKLGIIRKNARAVAKSILFAQVILIVALMPIFTFQKVEGKMFAPLAFTLGYALLGALLLSLTYVPAMCKVLLTKNVRDRENPVTNFFRNNIFRLFRFASRYKKGTILGFLALLLACGFGFTRLGTEFIPQLNEGALYIRASLPNSVNLDESVRLTKEMKEQLLHFDEVKFVLTQTGRPNDGTDPTGFFNIEFHVQLKDASDWRRKVKKDVLLAEIESSLSAYPGVVFSFSQPIMDNVAEYVAGVKSSLVVKVFGDDLYALENTADSIAGVLRTVDGITDLNIYRNIGLPELRIRLSESRMARYGVSMRDAQAVIELAIGGRRRLLSMRTTACSISVCGTISLTANPARTLRTSLYPPRAAQRCRCMRSRISGRLPGRRSSTARVTAGISPWAFLSAAAIWGHYRRGATESKRIGETAAFLRDGMGG